MRRSFTLRRAHVLETDGALLMSEVVGYTDSPEEAESILRSLSRLGSDSSIHSYEMTPTTIRRKHRGSAPVVWSVRAVRG